MYMAHERRRYILRLLQQRKHIRSSALARELGVTDETIRTDLVYLQQRGLLQREHGGARFIPLVRRPSPSSHERLDSQLATALIPHIPAHARIFLESGTFATAIAAHLGDHPCTIVTNSPDFMRTMAAPAIPQQLICTGGILIKHEKLLDSETARQQLEIDIAILSPPSVSPTDIGYHSPLRAAWAEAAIRHASATMLIVPAHALSAAAEHRVACSPKLLVTEDNLSPEFHHLPLATVPYISASSFVSEDDFDY